MPKVSQFQNKRRPLRLFALQCVHIVKTGKNMEGYLLLQWVLISKFLFNVQNILQIKYICESRESSKL